MTQQEKKEILAKIDEWIRDAENNAKVFENLTMIALEMECAATSKAYKNVRQLIESNENQTNKNMNTTEEKPARALDAPANHSLQDCLQELKAGRKAYQQLFLDEMIATLNGADKKIPILKHIDELVEELEGAVDGIRENTAGLGRISSLIEKIKFDLKQL